MTTVLIDPIDQLWVILEGKNVEPLFGSCSATLQCLSFHPCSPPCLHISRGVKGRWTKLKVCTYPSGAALRITGSRQESDLSPQFSTCCRINKNIFVSVWEPLGCTVLRHLAAAENPALMFIQVMTWAPTLQFAGNRNQEQSTFLSIFDLLTDIFWRWKAFGLTAHKRKPPAPR